MNKWKTKQIIVCLIGIAACKLNFAGCFPFIPAYFAAAYLENGGRIFLSVCMFLGMAFLLPVSIMAKYVMAILVTMVAVRLSELVSKGCYTWVAALTAGGATALLSAGGELLQTGNRQELLISGMEGVFVFAATMVLSRLIHSFLEFSWKPGKKQAPEAGQQERLLNYARSFQSLSDVFGRMNTESRMMSQEEMGLMRREITGKLCVSCDQCSLCWEQQDSPMHQCLMELLASLKEAGMANRDLELKMQEYCPHTQEMVAEAVRVFEQIRLNEAWYNRLVENREVIADQLDAMAYIMEDCARKEQNISRQMHNYLGDLKYRAKERGIRVKDATLWEKEDGRWRLCVDACTSNGCIATRELSKAVSAALGRKMMPAKDEKTLIGRNVNTFSYEEEPKYQGIYGVARLIKDGAAVSGDNFSFLEPKSGKLILCLSDGMGSGSVACKESETVIELIEKFVEAGFDIDTSVRVMNSAMVMKGRDDLFSTVDISEINLYDGSCRIYKIGASATFIKRSTDVECLQSTSLPVGVTYQLDMEKTEKQLAGGDFLVMVSDGVLEYLHVPHPEETMQEIIESIETNNATVLAKRILERVLLFTGGRIPDDMTVLAAAIWER
ncbi:MAG: SpoIIE family protein phosphatase [Roseburia sp.]